jgi:hypothetical protein
MFLVCLSLDCGGEEEFGERGEGDIDSGLSFIPLSDAGVPGGAGGLDVDTGDFILAALDEEASADFNGVAIAEGFRR